MLSDVYRKINAHGKRLEVVYAHSDENYQQFAGHVAQMPWLAIPFGDPRAMDLKAMYSITAVPVLVVLRKDGTVVTTNGRNDIYAMDDKAFSHWM